jgi:hypothetical protein
MKARWFLLWLLVPAAAALSTAVLHGGSLSQSASPAVQVIRLEKVGDFARGADWNALFKDYQSRGSYRNLVQLPDGRLLVTDTRTYNFLVFGPDGKVQKRLWPRGRRELSTLSIYNRPSWLSLGADRRLFVNELGRVRIFDLEGRPIGESGIDHDVDCLVPLNERTVAVAGWVLRTSLPRRYVIALVDLETGKETVLRDMADADLKPVRTKDGKYFRAQAPYAQIRAFVRALGPNEFAAGFSNWPEIEVFDASGKLLRSFRLKNVPPRKRIFFATAYDPKAAREKDPNWAKDNPYDKPDFNETPNDPGIYYFNLVVDRQGRLLVFSFPEEGSDPLVFVYSQAGDLIREAKIETGDYRITFSPGEAGPIFDGEFLITLAEEKAAKGIPLRLMKFKLSGL